MEIPFSELPGRHERHFRRKLNNPLFPRPINHYSNDDLLEVQRLDHEEIIAFLDKLRKLVKQAVALDQKSDSDVVLDLKAELEKHYEMACRLGDKQANNKAAIRDLMNVIMATVSRHAAGDSKAETELMQEKVAREQHFAMLENSLVADLLDQNSLILEDELVPVMLTEDEAQVKIAMTMLAPEQQVLLANDARELLTENGLINEEQFNKRLHLLENVS
jgi:hypothetical protein